MKNLICHNCGAQIPDDAAFCAKCGTSTTLTTPKAAVASASPVVAPSGVASLKCPSCGAPIAPKFGEMVITCEYCGSAVTLGTQGWTNIQKQTMLLLKVATVDQVNSIITPMMDKGLLHRHLHEDSKQEEMSLTYVPYWIVSVSARTSITATNETAQIAQTATTAALMGVIFGGMGGGFGGGGGRRGGGMGGRRAFEGEFGVSNPFSWYSWVEADTDNVYGNGNGIRWRRRNEKDRANGRELQLPRNCAKGSHGLSAAGLPIQSRRTENCLTFPNYPRTLRSSTETSAKTLPNPRQRPLSISFNHKKRTRNTT